MRILGFDAGSLPVNAYQLQRNRKIALNQGISHKIVAYDNYFEHLRSSEDSFQLLTLVPAVAFLTYVILFTRCQTKKLKSGKEWESKRRVTEVNKVGTLFN